ncbi:MAG: Rha family transcriptional regulator, partial [Desulfobacterales bacterium]|nr:Rha family transcriptional regulator [Desulfobacterales bacterium]
MACDIDSPPLIVQRNSVPLNFEVAHKYQQAGRAVRALKTYTITRYSSTFLAMGYRGSEAAQRKGKSSLDRKAGLLLQDLDGYDKQEQTPDHSRSRHDGWRF